MPSPTLFGKPLPSATVAVTTLTLLGSPAVLRAENPSPKLEEILVTGEPMQRQAIDTVSSISIVTGEDIQARNIRDIYDLLLRTPNVSAAKEDKFSVRGISNEGIGPGGTGRPTVSVFIDGARQAGRGVGNTWDVEQVEFYRGPQSTAFGPGSLAGAIVIETTPPSTDAYTAKLKLGAANDSGREAGIALGGPIAGNLGFRYAAETNQTDGEVTNTTLDDDTWQARHRYMQRIKLSWAGDGRYSALLSVQGSKLREGNEYLPPNTAEQRISTDNVAGYYNDDSFVVLLRQQLVLSEAVTAALILTHSDSYNQRKGDYDVSAEDNGFFVNTTDTLNTALELRLNYRGEGLRAVAGFFRSRDELDGSSVTKGLKYNLGGVQARADADLFALRKANTHALYSEADIDITPAVTVTLGGRYEENTATNRSAFFVTGAYPIDPVTGTTTPTDISPALAAVLDSDTTADSSDAVFLPKLALSYQLSDTLSTFVSHSYGYRAGSVDFVSDGESPTYGPEYTRNTDLGVKLQLDNWFVQSTLFRVDYEDMQIGVRVDASNFRTDNAGSARAQGLELELRGDLTATLGVFAGIGYTDTAFTDYEDDGVDYAGNHFPNAPRLTANAGFSYHHPSGFFVNTSWARTEYSFVDRDNNDSLQADARDLFAARLGYQGDHIGAEIYAQNLGDKFYVTDRFNSPSLGIDAVFVGDPREVGARLHYTF